MRATGIVAENRRIGTSGDSQGDSQNAENSRGRPATDGIGRRCAGGRADASGAAGGRDRAEKEICVKSGKSNDRARLAEAALFQWDKENEADSPMKCGRRLNIPS